MSDRTECMYSARRILLEMAEVARQVYKQDLDLPTLREAVMQAYDAAQAHLAELQEVPHE